MSRSIFAFAMVIRAIICCSITMIAAKPNTYFILTKISIFHTVDSQCLTFGRLPAEKKCLGIFALAADFE